MLLQKSLLKYLVALFLIAKYWQHPKCPLTGEWLNQIWYIYVMKCSNKKEWAIDTYNNFDGSQENHAGGVWVCLQRDSNRDPSGDEKAVHSDNNTGYANLYNVMKVHRTTHTQK